MIVLGIDPGTTRCGYGVIELIGSKLRAIDYGLLKLKKEESPALNLLFLQRALAEVIAQHKPDLMGVEKLFFNKNVTTALSVGQARGVILFCGADAGIPIIELTPQAVKIALTGYGRADKQQVGRMVKILLSLKEVPKPDDISDALAVAISASRHQQTSLNVRSQKK